MEKLLYHSRLRDVRFVVLVLLNLYLISGFLLSGTSEQSGPPGGWRRIDVQALQIRIEAGELLDIEAVWYQPQKAEVGGQGRE